APTKFAGMAGTAMRRRHRGTGVSPVTAWRYDRSPLLVSRLQRSFSARNSYPSISPRWGLTGSCGSVSQGVALGHFISLLWSLSALDFVRRCAVEPQRGDMQ